MSEGALQDQVVTQMFAGHETTAGILTHLLQLLKGSPEVVRRMRKEQDNLMARHGPHLTGELHQNLNRASGMQPISPKLVLPSSCGIHQLSSVQVLLAGLRILRAGVNASQVEP